MGADFSRIRSNPLLDFAGVELKQGGVLLDADFNELVAVADRRLRALASDVLGRSTVSSTTPDAFKVTATPGKLSIGRGRLYVDGLLAENHGAVSANPAKKLFDPLMAEVRYADAVSYAEQPYLPGEPALPTAGKHLVYLDVWQRELTHLERPALVEIAVGVETSSRLQTVWQVRVLGPDAGNASCATQDDDVPGWAALIAPSTGRLTNGTFEVPPEADPCELPPTGGYRGLENQTYRVEIHDPGQPGGTATFKWSRENASVGTRVSSVVSATELELQSLGRDDVLRFNTGDWVEVIDDVRELSQRCGEVRRITVNEAARRIELHAALPGEMLPSAFPDSSFPRDRNFRVRRWDQKHSVLRTGSGSSTSVFHDLDAGTTGVIPVPAAGTTLLLENGITVSFASTGTKGFRAGDYWVFAARSADASVEALTDAPARGIHHHYARLGIWDVAAGTVTDCRHPWPPPAVEGHDCSCTACVTEKSHASGQLTIQDAVNKVRETGGTVCIGPGRYALDKPVQLIDARSVRVRGQGPATLVVSPGAAFQVERGLAVAIENLAIVSLGQAPAIGVRTAIGLALRELVIAVADAKGTDDAAIALHGVVVAASIRNNAVIAPIGIAGGSVTKGDSKTDFLLGAALAIEDNLLWCATAGAAFGKDALHMLGTRIAGNEVLGCTATAISATGIGLPGSSFTVSGNSLSVTGNGISCGLDGAWIEGNKLTNTATGAAARARKAGIALVPGLDRNGSDQCQMLANQVTGFSYAGILIAAPARELIVKLNIIEKCGNGILCADDAESGSISVENNHLRDIGSDGEAAASTVLGIALTRSESANIAGNTLRGVGATEGKLALRAGIFTMGVQRVRVSGNEVTDIAAGQDFSGLAAGILLRAPYDRFDVSHNRVERETSATLQGGRGAWLALATLELDQGDSLPQVPGYATVPVSGGRVFVKGDTKGYMHTTGDVKAGTSDSRVGACGAVLGNELNAAGNAPAVDISAAGECLFNDNRVQLRGIDKIAAVRLRTPVAIVNANRVRGGGTFSIQLTGPKSAAVLGNITTGDIDISGSPLQQPWAALNLRA